MAGLAGRQTLGGSGGGSGLMNFLGKPELWQWLSGVGGGMSRASRGQGYDISGANQQLFGAMRDRKKSQAFDLMMKQLPADTFNPAQTNFLNTIKDYGAKMKVVQGVLFGSGKEPAVWRQKKMQMEKMGASPEIASGLATERLVWKTDPIEGTSTLMDSWTGKPYEFGAGASR